jgi:hypothetical protein
MTEAEVNTAAFDIPVAEEDTEIQPYGEPITFIRHPDSENPAQNEYEKERELLIKLALVVAEQEGVEVVLRGSTVDTVGSTSDTLFDVAQRINTGTRYAPVHSDSGLVVDGSFFATPKKYPPPLDINLKIIGDPTIVQQIFQTAHKVLGIPNERNFEQARSALYDKSADYASTWELYKPANRIQFSCDELTHEPRLTILWFTLVRDMIVKPHAVTIQTHADMTLDEYYRALFAASYQVQHHTVDALNITATRKENDSVAFDRRMPNRCFNLDGLQASLWIDHTQARDIDFRSPFVRDDLDQLTMHVRYPEIPDAVRLSNEAIEFFIKGIAEGDPYAVDGFVEATFRVIRKTVKYGIPFDSKTLQTTAHLMKLAAPLWVSRPHDEALLEAYEGDLQTATEINPMATLSLIRALHMHEVFRPDVRRVIASPSGFKRIMHRAANMISQELTANLEYRPLRTEYLCSSIAFEIVHPRISYEQRIFIEQRLNEIEAKARDTQRPFTPQMREAKRQELIEICKIITVPLSLQERVFRPVDTGNLNKDVTF